MKNTLIPSAVGLAVAGALVLTGCSEPSNDFKQKCKQAGGKVVRENDFEGETLGMAPMAFSAGKGGGSGSRSGSRGSSSGSSNDGGGLLGGLFGGGDSDKKKSDKPKSKAPSTKKKNDGWKLADGSKDKKPSKKAKKSKKHDDNDFLCVKNDTILFEEDE